MLLRVICNDGTFDLVKDFVLTSLIESCEVSKFKRAGGWVDARSPEVRRLDRVTIYMGPERRIC